MSARDRIRQFFLQHVGEVITTQRLREVGDISEYARRIRELRDEEGLQIKSHRDRLDLRPGEYVLETVTPAPAIDRAIPAHLRAQILERNGYTCLLCGAGPGDPDPTRLGRKLRLEIDHLLPLSQGGVNEPDNLRVLCSACNQARANIETASETARNLLARIRRAPRAVQREVYEALTRSFGGQ